ncbi:MAG: 2-oxoacid:acceptor oxidoreductase subunit alpha, partial [Alicyclobacillus sp.]|nr:2-oxoacid:acceptor oxidoreductase subunit alpha [Alicyclobacillus sp.]
AALFGTHGEIPKIVLFPATTEDCFYMMGEAFNLAEKYQCPVIVMTDLALSLSKQTTDILDLHGVTIDRGLIVTDPEAQLAAGAEFPRYQMTESGVSPRVFPGVKGGLHHVTGVEHMESGRPNETAPNRKLMMEKRMRKLQGLELPNSVERTGDADADLVIVGMGSNYGAIEEAMLKLQAEGSKVAHAHVRALLPFPTATLQTAIGNAKQVLVVENNATAQLKHLMAFFGVQHPAVSSLLKYDGRPFLPTEIFNHCKEMM